MIGDTIFHVAHTLDGAASMWLKRRAEKYGTHPDVLLMSFAREVIDRKMTEEALEKEFSGEGR